MIQEEKLARALCRQSGVDPDLVERDPAPTGFQTYVGPMRSNASGKPMWHNYLAAARELLAAMEG